MTCASRPRLWWTSFPNGEESALRMARKDIPSLRWFATMGGAPFHLILPIKKLDPWGNIHSVSAGSVASARPCKLHESVIRGDRKVPTFTTPSAEPDGCNAPEGSLQKCSEGAKVRWHGDLRRFAPWQYEPHAMMSAATQHCVNMPATVKEVLMGFQPRFTGTGKDEDMKEVTLPPTSRHRMLANTWHVGVAQAVLYMFLVLALVPSAKAATPIPPRPRLTCLHRITAWCDATPDLWAASAADRRMGHHRTVGEDDCAHAHMAMALNASHPALDDSNLSPAAALADWMYGTIGPDIVRWRLEVLSEIGDLVDDLVPDWASTLPSHVFAAYSGNGSRPLAALVIRVLLDAIRLYSSTGSRTASQLSDQCLSAPVGPRGNALSLYRFFGVGRIPRGKRCLHSKYRELPAAR